MSSKSHFSVKKREFSLIPGFGPDESDLRRQQCQGLPGNGFKQRGYKSQVCVNLSLWRIELINFIRTLKKVLLPNWDRPRCHLEPDFDRGHHQKAHAGGRQAVALEKVHSP